MEIIITILALIIGLLISICLHELGHMIPAKLFKVPVSEYMIGLGPTLWSKKIGETTYGFKAILLGGYTKILGMIAPKPENYSDFKKSDPSKYKPFGKLIEEARIESMKELPEDKKDNAFYNLSMPKKLVCMAGGIFTNLFLGFILFVIALGLIGGSVPSTSVSAVNDCKTSDYCIASRMGLQPGDKIIAINDITMNSWDDISNKIRNSPGAPIQLKIERDGSVRTLPILNIDRYVEGGKEIGRLGFSPSLQTKHLGLAEIINATNQQLTGTFSAITTLPYQTFYSLTSIFTHSPRGSGSVLSLVGAGQITVSEVQNSQNLASKIFSFLSILASLNIALFVLNIIPLLPFDGGHIVNALYEGIKRCVYKIQKKPAPAPVDIARTIPIAYFGWGFLIICTIILVLADIINPVSLV